MENNETTTTVWLLTKSDDDNGDYTVGVYASAEAAMEGMISVLSEIATQDGTEFERDHMLGAVTDAHGGGWAADLSGLVEYALDFTAEPWRVEG